jgi:hypothetical protein
MRTSLIGILSLGMFAACGHENTLKKVTAERAVADTGNALSVTPAEGGVAKLTATDAKSVSTAGKYKLTNENFHQFIAATDSVLALKMRDTTVRTFLDEQVTDAGNGTQVTTSDAGLKRLENNQLVSAAITSVGMSVRDYFVAAIAIAQGDRFVGDPNAAPPSAALKDNAEFLRAHSAELASLREREHGVVAAR